MVAGPPSQLSQQCAQKMVPPGLGQRARTSPLDFKCLKWSTAADAMDLAGAQLPECPVFAEIH
jgi:hypothetical protein